MRRNYLVPLVLCCLLSANAPAVQALDDALSAYDRGDHALARTLARPELMRGSAIAETIMAMTYLKGTDRDPAVAAAFLLRAAKRGYAPAQMKLADLLATGQGLPHDDEEAYFWYRVVAQRADRPTALMAMTCAQRLSERLNAGARARQDERAHQWQIRSASGQ